MCLMILWGEHTETRSSAGVMTRSPPKACELAEVNTLSGRVITCARGPPDGLQNKVCEENVLQKNMQRKDARFENT